MAAILSGTLSWLEQLPLSRAANPFKADGDAAFFTYVHIMLLAQGQLEATEQATRKAPALQPHFSGLYTNLAEIKQDRPAAGLLIRRWRNRSTRTTCRPMLRSTTISPGMARTTSPVDDLYELRKPPDAIFEWLQRA